jgi:serine/threonine protein kinase
LMDLGSGRERGSTPGEGLAGTPLYIAPEVITGRSGFTIRSDIYSIGVLLFFLLTGTYPVVASDLAALLQAHERGERRSLESVASGLPHWLLKTVERAIDPRPEGRYESAHALAADLTAMKPHRTLVRDATDNDSNTKVHDLCVRGNTLIERRGMANAQLAVELFQRAIALDRGSAAAHAGLLTEAFPSRRRIRSYGRRPKPPWRSIRCCPPHMSRWHGRMRTTATGAAPTRRSKKPFDLVRT